MNYQELSSKQSGAVSNACRQIVFALGALICGLMYSEDIGIRNNIYSTITLCLIVSYFIFDIAHYLYTYIKIREIQYLLTLAEIESDFNDDDKLAVKSDCFYKSLEIEEFAFKIFIAKIVIIPIICLSIILYAIF